MKISHYTLTLWLMIAVVFSRPVDASPEPEDIRLSTDPVLIEAVELDPLFFTIPSAPSNGLSLEAHTAQATRDFFQADTQERLESLYLKFIEGNPDNELVSFIYHRLGWLFDKDGLAFSEYGFVRDRDRAAKYFRLAVEHHPKDKVSVWTFRSRVNAAAMPTDPKESLRRYTESFVYLTELDKEELTQDLWYSERELAHRANILSPEARVLQKRARVSNLWEQRNAFLEVMAGNASAIARRLGVKDPTNKPL